MNPEKFIESYKQALAKQSWVDVEPLIHDNAFITFSNGTTYQGKPAIQQAFERNFSLIKSEEYIIANLHWVIKTETTAIAVFNYNWKGLVNLKITSGGGRGTIVIVNEGTAWKLITEHLGPKQN